MHLLKLFVFVLKYTENDMKTNKFIHCIIRIFGMRPCIILHFSFIIGDSLGITWDSLLL